MTKLEELRKHVNKISVSDDLNIEIEDNHIQLRNPNSDNESTGWINDEEIKPLIKALQELIK